MATKPSTALAKQPGPQIPGAKGPKPESWSWMMTTDTSGKTVVHCFKATRGGQHFDLLWEPQVSDFHDEQLSRASTEINSILRNIQRNNKDPKQRLAFIEFGNRLMLVWSQYGAVGPDGDVDAVAKALGLKLD